MDDLFSPLRLPNGSMLANRLCKAAMEECLAGPGQLPDARIERLYRRWAEGGAGLLITGNVMIDRRALTSPGTIVLEDDSPLEPFRRWADAARAGGGRVWMQINHPGRQVGSDMPGVSWGPSEVPVDLGRLSHRFAPPKEMTAGEIEETVDRFARTAARAEAAGFDGVQIHAAHGYLLSQFLSPLVNRRTDRWGGSPEGRARLLAEVIRAVRARVAPGFDIGVKINSSDFQRGGFGTEDVAALLGMLGELDIDLLELSGGSVESPVATVADGAADRRPLAREARFLPFAEELLAAAPPVPLMLTGGIARREVAEGVLAKGVAVAGMAGVLALSPDLPKRWAAGEDATARVEGLRLPVRDTSWRAATHLAVVRRHLHRLAEGRRPRRTVSAGLTLVRDLAGHRRLVRRYGAWLSGHPAGTAKG
ncbi:2,4-dienoyl-CoA reductase [Streptomyces sp. NPDC086023]|uniref:oxidoreductase n=1 Tax=Streptomyces sp. NPDC086023 TaxID=3365746 RepID=UPI0037D3E918